MVSQNSGAPGDAEPQVSGSISGGNVTVGGGGSGWTYSTIGVVHAPTSVFFPSSDSIAEGRNADGRMELFVIANNGHMYTDAQTAPNGAFAGWSSIGGTLSQTASLAEGSNADGRMELFAISNNGHMYTDAQTAPNGSFGSWSSMGS